MTTLGLPIGRQFFQHTVNFGADQRSFALPPMENHNHKAFDFEHLCKLYFMLEQNQSVICQINKNFCKMHRLLLSRAIQPSCANYMWSNHARVHNSVHFKPEKPEDVQLHILGFPFVSYVKKLYQLDKVTICILFVRQRQLC